MKSLFVSIITLSIIIVTIIINSIHLEKVKNEIVESIDNFPKASLNSGESAIADVSYKNIRSKINYLYLVLPRDVVEKFNENLSLCYAYSKSGDNDAYTASLFVLRDYANGITRIDRTLP